MIYEMIFGDEGLFDGAPEDVDMIGYSGGFYKNSPDGPMYCCGCTFTTDEYRNKGFIAMRRIIKKPKQWTWEDKKAGVLPEVGCDIQYIESQKRVSVIAINSNEIVLLAKSKGSKFFVLDPDSLLQYYNPSETLAEKAQREEDEFFFAMKDEWQNPKSPPISSASFEAGVRAAYRKLKGGE